MFEDKESDKPSFLQYNSLSSIQLHVSFSLFEFQRPSHRLELRFNNASKIFQSKNSFKKQTSERKFVKISQKEYKS